MLPTAEKETGREAVNRDFHNIDSLIQELNQPKEQINNGRPEPQPGGEPASHGNFSGNEAMPGYQPEEINDPISEDVARMSGKMIAGTIDTTVATGLSLYAKNSASEKFQATEKQLTQLEMAWQAVAQKYGYRVEDSPWFNVLLLNVAVYFPKLQDAKADRLHARIDEMQAKYEKLSEKIEKVEKGQDKK